jgi:hypothetical protein
MKFFKFFLLLVFMFGLAVSVNAAALTWSVDYAIDLSSPDVNLTILSGSEATSLVINAGNIQVVVANGDTFTVTPVSGGLTVSGDTTASVSNICTSEISTVTITGGAGGETITITPTGVACVPPSGGSTSGSRPHPTSVPATPAVPAVTSGAPTDCLPGYLFSPSTGKNCNAAAPATPATPATPAQGHAYAFGQGTVKLGTKGEACKAWQTFLNDKANAALVTDGWCGKLTIAAAKAWQASKGLKADGLLGPMSRTKAMMQ